MTQPNGTNITILTLNVNCLSRPLARAGLLDLIKGYKPDLLCLQEVNLCTEELILLLSNVGYTGLSNIDVTSMTSRGTALCWRLGLDITEPTIVLEERMMYLKLGGQPNVNRYAPSGRGRRMERRVFFGETLERLVRGCLPVLPIISGDFNCIMENIDAQNNPGQKKCEGLRQLIRLYNHVDAYRAFNPGVPGYTFVRNNTASRLDRFYVPASLMPSVQAVDILPAAFTDHSAVLLRVQLCGDIQNLYLWSGRSLYWKVNNSILSHPDFLINFEDLYKRLHQCIGDHDDICDWWEERVKPMFITFLKQFSIALSREQKQTKEGLYIFDEQGAGEGDGWI